MSWKEASMIILRQHLSKIYLQRPSNTHTARNRGQDIHLIPKLCLKSKTSQPYSASHYTVTNLCVDGHCKAWSVTGVTDCDSFWCIVYSSWKFILILQSFGLWTMWSGRQLLKTAETYFFHLHGTCEISLESSYYVWMVGDENRPKKTGWLIGARDVEEEIVCGEPVGTTGPEKRNNCRMWDVWDVGSGIWRGYHVNSWMPAMLW